MTVYCMPETFATVRKPFSTRPAVQCVLEELYYSTHVTKRVDNLRIMTTLSARAKS